ncbi:hypothetical protein D3C87_1301370 [compost metagenome]
MGAGDHHHASIRQFAYRIGAGQRTATQPQQWAFGLFHPLIQALNRLVTGRRQRRRRHGLAQHRTGNQATLNIDRDLDRHRATRHRLRIEDSPLDHGHRLFR